jgi:hypothetical protein
MGPTGPVRAPTLRRSRDAASRDQRVPTADAKSGSGPGASGARDASSERPARARAARGTERRGAASEPGARPPVSIKFSLFYYLLKNPQAIIANQTINQICIGFCFVCI